MLHVMIIALPETAGITIFDHILLQDRLSEPWADFPSSWSIAEVCPKRPSPPSLVWLRRSQVTSAAAASSCGLWSSRCGTENTHSWNGAARLSLGTRSLLQGRLGLSLQLTVSFQWVFLGGFAPDGQMKLCQSRRTSAPLAHATLQLKSASQDKHRL